MAPSPTHSKHPSLLCPVHLARCASGCGGRFWRAGHPAALHLPGTLGGWQHAALLHLWGRAVTRLCPVRRPTRQASACNAAFAAASFPTHGHCSPPSQGGKMHVLHGGREVQVDLAARNAKSSCFAAFLSGNLRMNRMGCANLQPTGARSAALALLPSGSSPQAAAWAQSLSPRATAACSTTTWCGRMAPSRLRCLMVGRSVCCGQAIASRFRRLWL